MASLIDVFGRLLLEDGGKQFVADAAKAGDQAGGEASRTMGSRLSKGLSTALAGGVKILGTGAAAAFGLATKGALEMENATARYRAETGATAEEAKAALSAVNAIAGRQRLSLEAVTDAAIAVRRDLGAVGAEADKLTEQFAMFGRVTKQDAAAAVSAFDDILDAWGLEASDAGQIMDALVVSGQKFGGAMEADQAALAALAPSLKAANVGWQDAISLLDIFKASGVDSTAAVTGMTKALGKVASPAELQALIADISATEDPFLRAQKAAELFGAKAGPKLANALAGKDLQDYAIDMDEAAGATQRAADALDSTFSAQVQRKISEVGAAIRQLGADFGPAVTGAASLASLGGALGLDKALAKGFSKLAGSALVKGAAGKAGAAIGLVFTTATFAADKAASLVADMFSKLPGSSKITSAASAAGGKLGNFMGSTLGKGLSLAFAAVAVVEVIDTYNKISAGLAEQTAQITTEVSEATRKQTDAELQQTKAVIEKGLQDINGVWDAGLFTTDARKGLEANLAEVNAELQRRAGGLAPALADTLAAGEPTVTDGAEDMVSGLAGAVTGAKSDAVATAAKTPQEVADAIYQRRDVAAQGWSALLDGLKNALSPAKERARLIGYLASDELRKALHSKDPALRAQAQATREVWLKQLGELPNKSGKIGGKAGDQLQRMLNSKKPAVREAARQIVAAMAGKLEAAAGKAGAAGTRAGNAFDTALRSAIPQVITLAVRTSTSPYHGKARGGPTKAGTPYWVNEETPRSELYVPAMSGYVLTHRDAMEAARASVPVAAAAPTSSTWAPQINVQGALPVRTTRDIIREMRRAGELGEVPPARLSPQYHRREATS